MPGKAAAGPENRIQTADRAYPSSLISRGSRELLRRAGIIGVVSFADPVPRHSRAGCIVFPGHIGTIYQAHNAVYLGRSTPRRLRLLPDGAVLSDRAIQKLRSGEKGWRYAPHRLVDAGAEEPHGDLRQWALHWIGRLTVPLQHGGNHKYAWGLDRSARGSLPAGLHYPKWAMVTPSGGERVLFNPDKEAPWPESGCASAPSIASSAPMAPRSR